MIPYLIAGAVGLWILNRAQVSASAPGVTAAPANGIVAGRLPMPAIRTLPPAPAPERSGAEPAFFHETGDAGEFTITTPHEIVFAPSSTLYTALGGGFSGSGGAAGGGGGFGGGGGHALK